MAKFQIQLSGAWRDFSDTDHAKLAAAWDAGLPSVHLQYDDTDYEVSFAKLEQRNFVTGRCRRIRPPYGVSKRSSASASTSASSSDAASSPRSDAVAETVELPSTVTAATDAVCDGLHFEDGEIPPPPPPPYASPRSSASSASADLAPASEIVPEGFECPCCMDDVPPMTGLRLCPMPKPLGCDHSMCKECFKRLVAGQIKKKEPSVCPMCPDTKASMIPSWMVARVLGKDSARSVTEIEQLHLGKAEGGKIRLWQCPTPDCNNQMMVPHWWDRNKITHKRRLFNCNCCKKKICLRCDMEEHSGVSCKQYQDWKKANATGDRSYAKLVKSGLIKPCPNCKSPILKDDGCNFMTCPTCKSPDGMCWETGKRRYGRGSCGGGHNCH